MLSPVRNWIKKTLLETVPVGTIWSDTKGDPRFEILTGESQDTLNGRWFKVERDPQSHKIISIDFNQTGTDPTFTTCSSFLPRFATKVRRAGGLPTRKRNWKGEWKDIGLAGFQLHTERIGWVPAALGYALYGGPKEGDFFQLSTKGRTEHVGIILGIQGETWSKVAGGAGGRRGKRDGVKRTAYEHRPHNLQGWIDVDVYFRGWNGPRYDYVVDPVKAAANFF